MKKVHKESGRRPTVRRHAFVRAGLAAGIAMMLGMSLLTYTTTSRANGRISLTDLNAQLTALEQRAEALRQAGGVPGGTIIMWSGDFDDIPAGWALCDGNNGTPDLRSRFVLGGSLENPVPEAGGHWNHRHVDTHRHLYVHNHGLSGIRTNVAGGHTHVTGNPSGPSGFVVFNGMPLPVGFEGHEHFTNYSGIHTHQLTKDGLQARTDIQKPEDMWTMPSDTLFGNGGNLPPYHSLVFIMKLPAD